jgi:uncharacterized protein (DUF1501 family)
MKRRSFLLRAGALAGSAALAQLGVLAARAATAGDYKALVCVYLYGGSDANNMLVPTDSAGYTNYANIRGGLALAQNSLLPLSSGGSPSFGLHPALPGLHSLWGAGKLAVVTNVGTLVQPLTKAEYLDSGAAKPASLFSHLDQQLQWQSSRSDTSMSSTGWGGRLADRLASLNSTANVPAMVSAGGNSLFLTGPASQALVIPAAGTMALNGFYSNPSDVARRSAMSQLLGMDGQNVLTAAAQSVIADSLSSSTRLNPILAATDGTLAARFGSLSGDFANQLLAIAKVIEARSALGARRQVFLVSLGPFDTHSDQLGQQQSLFNTLDRGLAAFHGAMSDIGAGSSVTSFTLSDFSRTFLPNTRGGSDHGWGGHHLVIGDAVHGGRMYGTMPTLELSGPDDTDVAGRWIPTTSVDQYAATMATWFGADTATLAAVLPNLSAFSPRTLSFL